MPVLAFNKIWGFISTLSLRQLILLIVGLIAADIVITEIIKKLKEARNTRKKLDKGMNFELKVIREFQKTFNMIPFHSLLFPWYDIETEADLAFVSDRGIFCIECKCWGSEDDRLCTAFDGPAWGRTDSNGKTFAIMNPFPQNATHVRAIREELIRDNPELGQNVPIYNVVFVQNVMGYADNVIDLGRFIYYSELRENKFCIVSTNDKNLSQYVIPKSGIVQFKEEHDRMYPVLNPEQVNYLGSFLGKHVADAPALKKHVEHIKAKEDKYMKYKDVNC